MRQQPVSVIRRRLCVFGAAASVLWQFPQIVNAQSASRVPRVGALINESGNADKEWIAFVAEMSRRGWVEGRTVTFERRVVDFYQSDRVNALIAELVARNVDVLYVKGGTRGALAAKNATKTIPVVFHSSVDPVGLDLVTSLGRPGGNLTGNANLNFDTGAKALQYLAEATGRLTRFAYIAPSAYRSLPFFPAWSAALAAAAGKLGAQIEFVNVDSEVEMVPTLKRLVSQGFDGATCQDMRQIKLDDRRAAVLFIEHRLPTLGDAQAGFLIDYSPEDSFSEASAAYVDQILRGAKPSELPIQQASKFKLVINLTTAKALHLNVPRSLIARADGVIQ